MTGTPKKELKHVLPDRIRGLFDCVVAGDDLKNGKPAPDPYLAAAKILRVDPSRCVVVENAPLGVESAKRAGMFCIALTTSLPKTFLKRADVIADKLEDIRGIIEGACDIK